MCGRFTATFEFSEIRVRWNLDRDLPNYTPRFNIAPEQISPTTPVIVRGIHGVRLLRVRGSLIPDFRSNLTIFHSLGAKTA